MLMRYSCFSFKEKHFRSLCVCSGNWLMVSGFYTHPTLCPYDKHLAFHGSGFLTSLLVVPLKTEHFSPSPLASWFYLSVAPFPPPQLIPPTLALCLCLHVNSVCVCLFMCLVSLGQAILAWLPAVLSVILASIDIQTEQLCLFMFFN